MAEAPDPSPPSATPAGAPGAVERVLQALAGATRPQRIAVAGPAPALPARWVAAGAPDATIHQLADPTLRLDGPYDLLLLDDNATTYRAWWERLLPHLAPRALLLARGALAQEERADALRAALQEAGWRHATIGVGSGLLAAARTERIPAYDESPRERFLALFLHVVQPASLVLGQNMVLAGALKPRGSRIQFSGMGGQIGAGDLLLTHPDGLQRYQPLPGALALVLGEPEEPIRAPHVALPLGDEVVTLVVA